LRRATVTLTPMSGQPVARAQQVRERIRWRETCNHPRPMKPACPIMFAAVATALGGGIDRVERAAGERAV